MTQIIKNYMSEKPHTIGADRPLSLAKKMMAEHGVRHLPVLEAGQIVGVITDRDVKTIEGLAGIDFETIKTEDCYSPDPLSVYEDADIKDVATQMAEKKYSCVLVKKGSELTGIFTWIDALKIIANS